MMSNRLDRNVKVYKNPDRNKQEKVAQYIPEYKNLEVEPEIRGTPDVFQPAKKRNQETSVRHHSNINHIPNSGNNVEQMWSSVDDKIIDDDISKDMLDLNKKMIDNNEFIAPDIEEEIEKENNIIMNDYILSQEKKADFVFKDDEYILVFKDGIIEYGNFYFIQDEVKKIVFGDHDLCDNGEPIAADKLSVFKLQKINIKVGVFLECNSSLENP